ncbi:hypothetical protein [Paraglaciecola sp. MB-3u-78]|uniref:hypothetical protein n=1 Tax=Paraglaciecola sp. MB-3u-78 TaxID=2058332 RepID=UPI000C33082F|nr:hypothetical protein [Paraglaciecola sp. MB-3u-78]PKG98355.1 hypothetical protein CXF95_18560 [Paraglaciecola sp. MB-3u-78]
MPHYFSQQFLASYWGVGNYPPVDNTSLVGTFEARAKAGGGYVWDTVLEYRVWCSTSDGAPDLYEGNDYYYVFETCEDTLDFSKKNLGCETEA